MGEAVLTSTKCIKIGSMKFSILTAENNLCTYMYIYDTLYHICTISDILRQGVDSLAQWLEHWISTLAIGVRIPSGTWDFLSYVSFLIYEFSYS